jgi:hypothetical protein
MSGSSVAAVARHFAQPSVLPAGFLLGDIIDVYVDFFHPVTREVVAASAVTARVWDGLGAEVSPPITAAELVPGTWRLGVPCPIEGAWRAEITCASPGTAKASITWLIRSAVPLAAVPSGFGPLFNAIARGYAEVTDLSASTALPSAPSGANAALVAVDGAGVRVRFDGTAPSASVGVPIGPGETLQLSGAAMLTGLRVIRRASGALLRVTWFQLQPRSP